jgi:RNA-directed DNA polymerase
VTFETIEAVWKALLERLRDELTGRTYQPLPALVQEIPKDGGKVSIPAIWSRVVQGALDRRRIKFAMASGCPYKAIFATA